METHPECIGSARRHCSHREREAETDQTGSGSVGEHRRAAQSTGENTEDLNIGY